MTPPNGNDRIHNTLSPGASGTGRKWLLAMLMLVFALCGAPNLSLDTANAQTDNGESSFAGAVPGGTTSRSAADAELWRQIRQGDQFTVVGQDKKGALLIQSGGQIWREARTGPLMMYTAWAILGVLFLLCVFFAFRGRIRIEHGFSGQKIRRFNTIERAGHWLLASSFIILALTGLNVLFGRALLLPVIGKDAFAAVTLYGKFIHNYVGFAFMVGLAMVAVMWIRFNFPNRHDVVWLLRGGGLFGGGHPPARKFNAGQKMLFWLIIVCGISISLSGWALLTPFTTTMFSDTFVFVNSILGTNLPADLTLIQEQQLQALWHTIMAAIMIAVVIGHIYIGTVGMEGAASAMTTGDVDVNWAREHHSVWMEEHEGDLSPVIPEGDAPQPAE